MCLGSVKLSALGKTAKVIVPDAPACLTGQTNTDHLIGLPYTHLVSVHRSCLCNELVSLHNRHLIDRTTPDYDPRYIKDSTKHILVELDVAMGNVEPIRLWDVVKSYSGAKRRTYARAYQDILDNGFNIEQSSRVKMFVKPDKYDGTAIYDKAPRAIQYRHPTFNLMLARYLKPIEHKLYEQTDEEGFQWCAKGKNTYQRAEMIISASECFDSPGFLLLDHSKFDSSVTVDHLKLMANKYVKWAGSKLLAELLKRQLKNKGVTKNGIRYRVTGTKMSGDFNTALDNSFLNYLVLRSWCDGLKIKAKYIIDGDDSVLVCDRRDVKTLMSHFNHFSRFGFKTECQIVYELSEVEFCRSHIIDAQQPIMAREPRRALSNMCFGLKRYTGRARLRYLAGNALGEMHRSSGCPILFTTALEIYLACGPEVLMDTEDRYKLELNRVDELIFPTDEIREGYSVAYGISPADQVAIEQDLRTWIKAGFMDSLPLWSLPESSRDIAL